MKNSNCTYNQKKQNPEDYITYFIDKVKKINSKKTKHKNAKFQKKDVQFSRTLYDKIFNFNVIYYF